MNKDLFLEKTFFTVHRLYKWSHLNSQHHLLFRWCSLLSQGDGSVLSLFIWAPVPADRPAAGGSAAVRRCNTFICLESFGSSQPNVKACLRAAGCFLTELIPTAAGSTSHCTHAGESGCKGGRDKHVMLMLAVRDWKQNVTFRLLCLERSHRFRSRVVLARVWWSLVSFPVYAALHFTSASSLGVTAFTFLDVLYHSELKIFGFYSVGWTKWDIWTHQQQL